ncbi:long-chain fatty acid--CoA ligase, partial [bacterium]
HIFERTIGQYLMLLAGTTIAYSTSIRHVADNIPKVQPTVMIGVPRFFEKLHTKVTDAVRQAPALRRAIFHWAIEVGKKRNGMLASGEQPGALLNMKYSLADHLVFGKLKEKLGGRLRFFVSGGAPLSADIIEFFLAAGIEILEGYGLTETSPVIATNRLGRIRPGTVGMPLPGVDVKIAEDGEILVKGPSVMLGYYEDEEATAEAIKDGWLHTGDLGKIEDCYLSITGRKKEIIVTAGGKNVSPARVENLMVEDDLIAQVMVYGDRRRFLSALVVPDYDRLIDDPASFGLGKLTKEDLTPEKLAQSERLNSLIMEHIDARSGDLASFERIKKIALLPEPFTEEAGELTPTMKIKRRVVVEKYEDQLDALYE